jgi:hypothetical protein
MMALRVSLCRGNMHAPAQPLHLPLQVCRRELGATAHPGAKSIATTPPASAFPASVEAASRPTDRAED